MPGIWLRAIVYMLIVGGFWLLLLPAGLLLWEQGDWRPEFRAWPLVATGAAFLLAGVTLAGWAGFCLIHYGHGTPLPLDPTRQLVTCGPYRHVRNPQGIAMMLLVAGEVLIVRSTVLWMLLPLTLAYLELLVGPWEERHMLQSFGQQYSDYARATKKWRPRIRWP